jgi:hypothetical protein
LEISSTLGLAFSADLTEAGLVIAFESVFVGVEPGFHHLDHPEDGIRPETAGLVSLQRTFAVAQQDVPGRWMLPLGDTEIPFGSSAGGDDREFAPGSAGALLDLLEEDIKSRFETLIALKIDAESRWALSAAPADFALAPKFAQGVVLQPLIQFVLCEGA